MTKILWLTEWVPPLYYQESVCLKTLLIESSGTEALARVSKKGMHVTLPIPSAPMVFWEPIMKPFQGWTGLWSHRLTVKVFFHWGLQKPKQERKQATKKNAKQDEWFFKRETAIPAPLCQSSQILQVHWSWGINTGSMRSKLQCWELSHSYWGTGEWTVTLLLTSCALQITAFARKFALHLHK